MMQRGTRLNDTYELLEPLGAGGGGIVYKAYHERLDTYVVVKQIKDGVKGILESRGEADILKHIKHTRLPRVYDFLEIGGEIYTVIDYIPGDSLDKILKRNKKISQKEVLKWALQLADALAYLHSQKPSIVHGDIKPANIMLTPERDICLIDFNVSLVFDQTLKTSTGISDGYSPPEQFHDLASYCLRLEKIRTALRQSRVGIQTAGEKLGNCGAKTELLFKSDVEKTELLSGNEMVATELLTESATEILPHSERHEISEHMMIDSRIASLIGRGIDERSDIYSLGATLYHLLTGKRPSLDFEDVIPVEQCGVKVSEGLAIIINKMMALEPEKRYQNGMELLNVLNHIEKLDSEYQAYRRRAIQGRLMRTALYVVGSLLVFGGVKTMERETAYAYNRMVEAASQMLDSELYEKAEKEIQSAMAILPERIEAYEKELQLLYSMGRWEEAIAYGKDVISNPAYEVKAEWERKSLGNLYYILGNAYFELEEYREAIACFSDAIEKNQDNSLYYRDLAIAYAKTGSIEAAEETLEEAITWKLGEDSIYMVQGEIAFAKGDNETALVYLEQSMRSATTDELRRRATLLSAQVCRRLGNAYLDQEIGILERAEAESTGMTSMHISEQLADAYARKAGVDSEEREQYFSMALARFQTLFEQGYATRQMMENIAVLYQQTEQLDEAEQWLSRICEQYPQDYRGYKRLAFLEADRQQKRENLDRDYVRMKEYSDLAKKYYEETKAEDTEMLMLEQMLRELADGGWLE